MKPNTMAGVESDRIPFTREQLKKQQQTEGWVSPGYGDGGWHNNVNEDYDVGLIVPLKDRILVKFLPVKMSSLVIPENARTDDSIRAVILRTGTGRRYLANGEERECYDTRAGDEVVLGPHSDWISQDGRYGIYQEADVRCIVRRDGHTERSGKEKSS